MSFAALLGDDSGLGAGRDGVPTSKDLDDDLLNELEMELEEDGPATLPAPAQAGPDADQDDYDEDDDDEDDIDLISRPAPSSRPAWTASAAGPSQEADPGDDDAANPPPEPLSMTLMQDAPNLSDRQRKEREMNIVKNFDVFQMERYESYKRSKIDKKNMKKLASAMLGTAVPDQVLVILCGITKLFVGEVVESARILAHRSGHHGALMPAHIHEAYQVMRSQGRIGSSHKHSKMFRSRPS